MTKPDRAVTESLSIFEQYLSKTNTRIEIKAKRGRMVPVLQSQHMEQNINALMKIRDQNEVKSERLFARPGVCNTPYRDSNCLRALAKECGAQAPELLTSTRLRKQ